MNDYGYSITRELVLEFLQGRGIAIDSLDIEGVQEWAENCRETGTPSASFSLDFYSGDIAYTSGTGNTKIVVLGDTYRRDTECELYSIDDAGHVEALSRELVQYAPERNREYAYVGYAHVGSEAQPEKIIWGGMARMKLDYDYGV